MEFTDRIGHFRRVGRKDPPRVEGGPVVYGLRVEPERTGANIGKLPPIVFEVTGTMSLRASEGFRRTVWIAPVIASYVIAFTLLFLCLAEGMPVGVAYGIWSATGVALTAVLAKILFDEPFTWLMGLGVVAIAGGVLLIEIGAS